MPKKVEQTNIAYFNVPENNLAEIHGFCEDGCIFKVWAEATLCQRMRLTDWRVESNGQRTMAAGLRGAVERVR